MKSFEELFAEQEVSRAARHAELIGGLDGLLATVDKMIADAAEPVFKDRPVSQERRS